MTKEFGAPGSRMQKLGLELLPRISSSVKITLKPALPSISRSTEYTVFRKNRFVLRPLWPLFSKVAPSRGGYTVYLDYSSDDSTTCFRVGQFFHPQFHSLTRAGWKSIIGETVELAVKRLLEIMFKSKIARQAFYLATLGLLVSLVLSPGILVRADNDDSDDDVKALIEGRGSFKFDVFPKHLEKELGR